MCKKKIEEFIEKNNTKGSFTGGIDEKKILYVEKSLDVLLPESYKWFLKKYGHGGIFGIEILGYGKSPRVPVIEQTIRYRKLGLSSRYVVIENSDEWVYCLDLNSPNNAEDCCVVSCDRSGQLINIQSESFYKYLLKSLIDAKENWDWFGHYKL